MATAHTVARTLDEPVEIGGRRYVSGCDLGTEGLVPYPGGLELKPLIEQLSAFPKPQAWSVYLRRALQPPPDVDATLLWRALRPLLT
ncbi:hypothetical protein [Micromonospora avicenniae]|uniref:hypothetical protein n=1 Tax=Micromonospora avicenniae TaxID=1198245 RepID=UPI003413AC8A